MPLGTSRRLDRRRFVCTCCAGAVVAWVPTVARAADEVVPTSLEPHHHKRLENEYLRVIEVLLDPGDSTLFHQHSLDFALVPVQGAELKNEVPNSSQAAVVRLDTDSVRFSGYQAKPYAHRVTNLSPARMDLLSFEILIPAPGGFGAADRSGASAYRLEVDNERLRAWRLRLDPGQSAPPVVQSGPGLRVVLAGDRLTEKVEGAAERDIGLRRGDFAWQPPGATRALANAGTSPVELVEFELR